MRARVLNLASFAPNGLTPSASNLPGGCTRDIVHQFYQEQYQLNGGRAEPLRDAEATLSASTMGYYNTRALPIYQYLHSGGHPHYAIADDFFQAAFGGSFLNHQWLIAAATPTWPEHAAGDQHSIIDSNGMPRPTYPLYNTGPASRTRDRHARRSAVSVDDAEPSPAATRR